MPRIFAIVALLGVVGFTVYSLVSGATYLDAELPGGLPFGNALTALGICSLAGVAVILSPPGGHAWAFARGALIASTCWLPVSVLLAGNLALNFSGGRGTFWLAMSLLVIALVLFALAWAVVLNVVFAIRRARSQSQQ